jgi:hypothetical protein
MIQLWYFSGICGDTTDEVHGWFSILCDYTCHMLLDGECKCLDGDIKDLQCLFSLEMGGGGAIELK